MISWEKVFRSLDVDETEEDVYGDHCIVTGWHLANADAATIHYVKFYDGVAATVAVGTDTPVLTIKLNAGGTDTQNFTSGIEFPNGVCIAAVTEAADSGTTGAGANEVIANVLYKPLS